MLFPTLIQSSFISCPELKTLFKIGNGTTSCCQDLNVVPADLNSTLLDSVCPKPELPDLPYENGYSSMAEIVESYTAPKIITGNSELSTSEKLGPFYQYGVGPFGAWIEKPFSDVVEAWGSWSEGGPGLLMDPPRKSQYRQVTYPTTNWDGLHDHSVDLAMGYDSNNVYLHIVVTDDIHVGCGADGLNGDALQLSLTSEAARMMNSSQVGYPDGWYSTLINLGQHISGNETHPEVSVPIMYENNVPGYGALADLSPVHIGASVERDETHNETHYKIRIPALMLNVPKFTPGFKFGLGFGVGEDDDATDGLGLTGWSGWHYDAVYYSWNGGNKSPHRTGLVTLGHELAEDYIVGRPINPVAEPDAWPTGSTATDFPMFYPGFGPGHPSTTEKAHAQIDIYNDWFSYHSKWTGKDDLSGQYSINWTPDKLYMRIIARDQTHSNVQPPSLWPGGGDDSLLVHIADMASFTECLDVLSVENKMMFIVGLFENVTTGVETASLHGTASGAYTLDITPRISVVRDDLAGLTTYDIEFLPAHFGVNKFIDGWTVPLSLYINDGRDETFPEMVGQWTWENQGTLTGIGMYAMAWQGGNGNICNSGLLTLKERPGMGGEEITQPVTIIDQSTSQYGFLNVTFNTPSEGPINGFQMSMKIDEGVTDGAHITGLGQNDCPSYNIPNVGMVYTNPCWVSSEVKDAFSTKLLTCTKAGTGDSSVCYANDSGTVTFSFAVGTIASGTSFTIRLNKNATNIIVSDLSLAYNDNDGAAQSYTIFPSPPYEFSF